MGSYNIPEGNGLGCVYYFNIKVEILFIYKKSKDDIFWMTNLNPKKTGLSVIIWSDHVGVNANRPHNDPKIKIGNANGKVSVSIEPQPKILAKSKNLKKIR